MVSTSRIKDDSKMCAEHLSNVLFTDYETGGITLGATSQRSSIIDNH